MLRTVLKSAFNIILWCVQLLVLLGSFIAFSSTIEILPWYEPLTMGAFFFIIAIIPVQIVLIAIYLIKDRKLHFKNSIKSISIINELMLLIVFTSTLINEEWFYPVCVTMTLLEMTLIVFLLLRIREWKR